MKKIHCFISLMILFGSLHGVSQHLSALNTGKIVELECIEVSPEIFVTAVMERDSTSLKTYIRLFRSTDNGSVWNEVTLPADSITEAADPILIQATSGTIFLLYMELHNTPSFKIDLKLLESTDNGLNWSIVSTPHFNNGIADYPQLATDPSGKIFLTYTWFEELGVEGHAIFKSSADNGLTWTDSTSFTNETGGVIGPDIHLLPDSELFISWGNTTSNEIHYSYSSDLGNSWSTPETVSNLSADDLANITKILSYEDASEITLLNHQPHQDGSLINYHASSDGGISWTSEVLDTGAYAQGCFDTEGTLHITYSKSKADTFYILYTYCDPFTGILNSPTPLYAKAFNQSQKGEYQSFFYSNDGYLNIVFCDWSDASTAKIIKFSPELLSVGAQSKPTLSVYPNPFSKNLTLNIPEASTGRLTVIDGKGHAIYTESFHNTSELNIETTTWPSGYFILNVEINRLTWVFRTIKR